MKLAELRQQRERDEALRIKELEARLIREQEEDEKRLEE